jgi:hypothetical protein
VTCRIVWWLSKSTRVSEAASLVGIVCNDWNEVCFPASSECQQPKTTDTGLTVRLMYICSSGSQRKRHTWTRLQYPFSSMRVRTTQALVAAHQAASLVGIVCNDWNEVCFPASSECQQELRNSSRWHCYQRRRRQEVTCRIVWWLSKSTRVSGFWLLTLAACRKTNLVPVIANNADQGRRVDLDSHQTILHVTSCLLLL